MASKNIMIIVILFVFGCVLLYFFDVHQSKVKHLEDKLEKLQKEKERLELLNIGYKEKSSTEMESSEPCEEYSALSLTEYFQAIDEIEKDAQMSPLERIYFESELPDQLKDTVPLRVKVREQLDFLERRGIMQMDISAAKEIVKLSLQSNSVQGFEGFISYTMKLKGEALTKEIYPALIKIFEVSGLDISEAECVYHKLLKP